jgi:hypothetical protein
MPRNDPDANANPLKEGKPRKATTQRLSDHARPGKRTERGSPKPDTTHPAQRGGVTALDNESDPRELPVSRRPGVQREGSSLTKAPARSRVGPKKAGKSRPGRTAGTRQTKRRRD